MRVGMARLRGYKAEGSYRTLLDMLSNDLNEQRKKNDTAQGNQIYRNQGAVQYIRGLLKELGWDEEKKLVVYDGAFD